MHDDISVSRESVEKYRSLQAYHQARAAEESRREAEILQALLPGALVLGSIWLVGKIIASRRRRR